MTPLRLIVSILVLLLCPVLAHAQSDVEKKAEAIAQEIDNQVMSPFCPGRTLAACPSEQARDLRLQIIQWLKEGQTTEQIRERLVAMYGQEVLGVPQSTAVGMLGWLAPVLFVVVFLACIFYVMRGMRNRPRTPGVSAGSINDEVRLKIEREVKERLQS